VFKRWLFEQHALRPVGVGPLRDLPAVRGPSASTSAILRRAAASCARTVQAAGVADRAVIKTGSFFAEVPGGGDLYVLRPRPAEPLPQVLGLHQNVVQEGLVLGMCAVLDAVPLNALLLAHVGPVGGRARDSQVIRHHD
jgi:hypothetical protein